MYCKTAKSVPGQNGLTRTVQNSKHCTSMIADTKSRIEYTFNHNKLTLRGHVHRNKETNGARVTYRLLDFSIAEFKLPIKTGTKEDVCPFTVALGVYTQHLVGEQHQNQWTALC